ncbi:hypothetical protein MES4922_20150 [Mesorhizobium ventifaucium]|uniref:DUF982 domain-containing protein n=1 Tax=Mesorhizobium ventifaucium TaxID=666020 RepID=A0ABM9DPH4_9HYPH|nr:hypothetical protein MES4922_20150 [Mesorhizobium ventifaucium]
MPVFLVCSIDQHGDQSHTENAILRARVQSTASRPWTTNTAVKDLLRAGCTADRQEAQPLFAAQSGAFRRLREITHARDGSALDLRMA